MNREEIMVMPAGRELDALVEKHIFGKQVEWVQDDITDHYPIVPAEYGYIVETYSTDMSAAWEMLEQFQTYQITKMHNVGSEKETKFRAIIKANKNAAYAETMPLAACRAALLAMEASHETET